MSLRCILLIISLSVLTTGCSKKYGNREAAADSSALHSETDTCNADLTERIMEMTDSVLMEMTIEQRVGQCFMPSINAVADSATLCRLHEYIADLHVGGILLLKGNLASAVVMTKLCKEAAVPLFASIDAEWGLGMRLEDAPVFPRNGRLSRRADEQLLYDYGREVARECRRVGIDIVLGPVMDVAGNPDCVIGNRSFGNDPARVADLGVAYALGVESGGVISVAKHFPGHGSLMGDSHLEMQVIRRSFHELDSIDLYPFKSYIDAGLSGIMVGHLAVPAIDPKLRPAAVSVVVINDLLRKELGFKGLVLTDALNMGGACGYDASAALTAGADIIISPSDTYSEITGIIKKIATGEIDMKVIDDHCRRILFYKLLFGLWQRNYIATDRLHEDVMSGADSLCRRLQH